MGSSDTTADDRPESPVDDLPDRCTATCPHYQAVSGRCGHELSQTLRAEFVGAPETTCPVYEGVRDEAMTALADRLESR